MKKDSELPLEISGGHSHMRGLLKGPEEIGKGISVLLLTGGSDKPYVYGLTSALSLEGVRVGIVGSDELDLPEIRNIIGVSFFNLRGDQRSDVSFLKKMARIISYYVRLVRFASRAESKLFHILWNNKFEAFDRTFLMLYYRLLGKKIVLTAHNVNASKRDGIDSFVNRITLKIQYSLAHHIFVHTELARSELRHDFRIGRKRISLIPFGINNFAPVTPITAGEAKKQLGIENDEKVILFFGRITPYKGLEYLVAAFKELRLASGDKYRLIIAGRLDGARGETYWDTVCKQLDQESLGNDKGCLLKTEYIPDGLTEVYFKASDVIVLPYTAIYQSGVLFLAQSFGLPVIAADVDSFVDEIVEGETGFVFRAADPVHLARTIEKYFRSELFGNLDKQRQRIREIATRQHSWQVVGQKTLEIYAGLLSNH
jgi:glycosyltransferase involved in cell wall biosynthesis